MHLVSALLCLLGCIGLLAPSIRVACIYTTLFCARSVHFPNYFLRHALEYAQFQLKRSAIEMPTQFFNVSERVVERTYYPETTLMQRIPMPENLS